MKQLMLTQDVIQELPKDKYLQKHHENVMYYSTCIALKLGISNDKLEVVRRAALYTISGKRLFQKKYYSKPGSYRQVNVQL
ncbi:hypothetical protein N752_29705 [Desulforamulus aquiferis]|nr:hypothetical protein [Desulforamulus aquiferis]RYD01480.1 hypothetical protein N752_29705 [Desulforamulus aquiferis]